jgi:hypothetical protein
MAKEIKKETGFASRIKPFLLPFVFCSFLAAALYLWRGEWYWCLFPYLLFVMLIFLVINKNHGKASKESEEDEEQFVSLFSYFSIFVQDGFNVFNALQQVVPYSSLRMKERLKELLDAIEGDKTLAPYLAFAAYFPSLDIKEVMLAVYQMVDQGSGGVYLIQFQRLFAKLSEQKRQRRERKYLERLDSLSLLPLLGSGFSMLMLMLSMMEILGDMINGL